MGKRFGDRFAGQLVAPLVPVGVLWEIEDFRGRVLPHQRQHVQVGDALLFKKTVEDALWLVQSDTMADANS